MDASVIYPAITGFTIFGVDQNSYLRTTNDLSLNIKGITCYNLTLKSTFAKPGFI